MKRGKGANLKGEEGNGRGHTCKADGRRGEGTDREGKEILPKQSQGD